MDKKKILIVSRSFYPQNSPRSFRTTELAKEFARQGHEVTVLTPKNHDIHPIFEKEHGVKLLDLGTLKWKSVNIGGKGLIRLIRRVGMRLPLMLFEYPNIELFWKVKKKLKKEAGYDLLISIAVPYPVHWGVAASRSKKHPIAKVWVADCGDPYMGRENDTFRVPFYFGYIEKWFMRKADYVTVPTEGAIKAYYSEFHKKMKVIPQGFRFEDYQFPVTENQNRKTVFAYAGSFIPGRRDPNELIRFLQTLNTDFEFHIFTQTPHFIQPLLPDKKHKIIIHKPIPREELLKILSGMYFLVNFENTGTKQTPSKLIDYIILDKPVLSIKTGKLDQNAVKEFLSANYQKKMTFESPEQYRIENVCKKFIELLG